MQLLHKLRKCKIGHERKKQSKKKYKSKLVRCYGNSFSLDGGSEKDLSVFKYFFSHHGVYGHKFHLIKVDDITRKCKFNFFVENFIL